MKRRLNATFFSVLALAFLAFAALWLGAGYPVAHVPSGDGTRDLRAADFSSSTFDLSGPVEYIPNALLTPQEFSARPFMLGEEPGEPARYRTSRLRILAPEGIYGLMMWNAEFAASIYINGELMERVGVPARDAQHAVAGTKLLFFTANAPNGVIEIVQQASTYVLPEVGGHADIIIGKPEIVRGVYNRQNFLPSIAMGCFLALALAHLVLFFLLRMYKANLWLSLFCFVWFLRTGYAGPWVLSPVFALPWTAAFRLCCLSYAAGLLLLGQALHALFPGALQRRFRIALCAACAAFACVCLLADTAVVSEMLTVFYGVIFAAVAYLAVRLCIKVRRPSIEQSVVLVGMGIFVFGALRDILYFDVLPMLLPVQPNISELTKQTMAEYALLVFAFFQMAAMFRGTMREAAAAREAEQAAAMENALLAREAKVREEMVRTFSHEVRTPLTVISTYAQLAVRQIRQGNLDEQTIDGLDAVYAEAQRIADLAAGALSPRGKDDEVIDLAAIARQLARLYAPVASTAGRALTVNLARKLPARGNAGEIAQVISNLLDNAVKHGKFGGIDLDGNMNDEFVYVIVTDYGAGIPPALLPGVLTRGVSGGVGLGLGLAIADDIARKHGGRLLIESEVGLGTVATLLLPASRDEEDAAQQVPRA